MTDANRNGTRCRTPIALQLSPVADQRVISGIVHMLKSGGRWSDAPQAVY